MRSVSAIAAEVTPRSAARAKSGRTISSGRTRLEVETTLPIPGSVRSSCSTRRACAASTAPSSPARTRTYFSLEPPKPTLTRAPGSAASASRSSCSMVCLVTPPRSSRGVRLIVSVALRTSAAPPGANGSAPVLPPPTAV
jgi:hypothetical protein